MSKRPVPGDEVYQLVSCRVCARHTILGRWVWDTDYLNSAIMHGPFVPFSVLFTRAVQHLDIADLARLDRFAASLQSEENSPGSITHPYQLYELLCQSARIYFDISSTPANSTLTSNLRNPINEFGLEHSAVDAEISANRTFSEGVALSDWYYGNQQIMNLFEEDEIF